MFLNNINEKIVERSKVRSTLPDVNRQSSWCYLLVEDLSVDQVAQEVRLLLTDEFLMFDSLLATARPRPSQSDSCGGGDLPGVLRLGTADHAHADREHTHIRTHTASQFHCSTDHLNVYIHPVCNFFIVLSLFLLSLFL